MINYSGQRVVSFRERHSAMIRAWSLSMSLPAVQFRILFGAGFSKKYHVSPLSILGHCFDVVSLGKARHSTLKCFTWLKWKWVPVRKEMAMCMISPMRRNGCRTVCSPWIWDGTPINMSQASWCQVWSTSWAVSTLLYRYITDNIIFKGKWQLLKQVK